MALEPDKSSMTLDKSLYLSEPQFPQVKCGVIVRKLELPCIRHHHGPVAMEGSHWGGSPDGYWERGKPEPVQPQ